MIIKPFNPKWGSNQVVTAGVAALISIDATCETVRVTNSGSTNKGYVRTYDSKNTGTPPVASAVDLVVLPNMATTFTKDLSHDTLSYFSAAGTTLEIMTGTGGA